MILIVGGSCQGKTDFARKNFPNAKYFNQLHLFIRKRLENGKEQAEILSEIKEEISEGPWVLISDEIGNGVVPIELFERQWREVTGRILISLAKEATEVYKVVCGIGMKIK
ncbi:adenosylcobinamide kinase /adenosylcobinamide-phosphate guanylyltransferase [Pseudobutyrivibrio sp. ACV-2]|uniref:bifunctional adenosylcobinamide kinase/adenosylcobinamide-phosphate guanylyltransferase n=1 Tax=Pseudobutyrivibrio sp. ACV-2 TaxID=1520801 RepID=UPI000898FEA1|nr:bifunctional adenosylcobinamide kinase/adenosylcobinamide-phosphate guanylyltransferase [Pseudobutyrivibrio sp. ACV-2]SEA58889.1 adenosylcobinamide kinase /adenosylcobinamide-phosphate guanylyltransferase [Pseudobutyrivibrio sp. ACV-2]